MTTLNERLNDEIERIKQLRHLEKMQAAQERKKKEKHDTRRKIIIGGLVLKYFPKLSAFEPRRTMSDNNAEFAPLENALSFLAGDKTYIAELKEKAKIVPSETNAHLHIAQVSEEGL